MRRALRHLFTILSAMSLLLCAAICVLWVRSYWFYDSVEWGSHYRTRFVGCDSGRVLLQVNHGCSRKHEFDPMEFEAYRKKPEDTDGMGRPWEFGGFWVANLAFAPTKSRNNWVPYTDIVVPLYAVVIASLFLPGVALLRAMRRSKPGMCPKCGYDLRASPELCPECGLLTAGAVPAGRGDEGVKQ